MTAGGNVDGGATARTGVGHVRRPWLSSLLATTAVLLLVAMQELNRLSGAALDEHGRSWSFTTLMGPGVLVDRSSTGWAAGVGEHDAQVAGWLTAYLILDLVFVGVYVVGLGWLFFWHRYRTAAFMIFAVGAVDLAEDVAALTAGRTRVATEPTVVERVLPVLTSVKWVLVLLVLVAVLRRLLGSTGTDWRLAVRRVSRSVYFQRFSVLAVLPVAILAVVPGKDILDQLPDIQRRWSDDLAGTGHAVAAMASLLLLAVVLLVLGRLRSGFAHRLATGQWPRDDDGAPARPAPALLLWVIGPIVVVVLWFAVLLMGVEGTSWQRLLVFVGVPVLIFLVSGGLRRWSTVRRPDPLDLDAAYVPTTTQAGDALAVSALVIGGLGLVRSFTAVVALGPTGAGGGWPPGVYLAIGVVLAIAAAVGGPLLVGRLSISSTATGQDWWTRTRKLLTPTVLTGHGAYAWPRVLLLCLGIVVFVVLGSFPVAAVDGIGLVACIVLALTALTVLVGSTVVIAQDGGAPEVFWPAKLRAAPIASMLILAIVAAGLAGNDLDVHAVRGVVPAADRAPSVGGTAPLVQRRTIDEAYASWVARTKDCGRVLGTVGGAQVRVRPMLLVAAEGGGIRAAYWTAGGLQIVAGDRLDAKGGTHAWQGVANVEKCRTWATLLSGGASGGAVGLTVSRFAALTGRTPTPVDQVSAMAASPALGSGVVGLAVRDLALSSAGVPLPVWGSSDVVARYDGTAGNRSVPWADRAALIESVWETTSASLAKPFLLADLLTKPSVATGQLVLTSTSVATGCRAFVSQLTLPRRIAPGVPTPTPAPSPSSDEPADAACDGLDSSEPNGVDLLAGYGRVAGDIAVEPQLVGCLDALRSSTAAMLASRFPYVTPSGVVGSCNRQDELPQPAQQLVDGGYVENTGLGTLVDLADDWQRLVRASNTKALADGATDVEGGDEDVVVDLIVPVVVFFDNGPGSDLTAPTRPVTSEILVPPVAGMRAGGAQSSNNTLLQQAAERVEASQLFDGDVDDELLDLLEARRSVFVVHQSTAPSVAAPLGWVLSKESIATLDRDLYAQSTTSCDEEPMRSTDAMCVRGYGSLADLVALLTPED